MANFEDLPVALDQATSIDRFAVRRRPVQLKRAGFQNWSNLLFAHWQVPAEFIQSLIPGRLSVDTFGGHAWLGLVPFQMSGVRPFWSPAIPWVSHFCETNLRTYVHLDGRDPGVWFFSLEASRLLAVHVARKFWNLNYHWARMQLDREADQITYSSQRLARRESAALQIFAEIGEVVADDQRKLTAGSLEDFLVERYLLYTSNRKDELLSGRVYHTPYPLRRATLRSLEQSITDEIGIELATPDHVLFSEGVRTEIYALQKVASVGS